MAETARQLEAGPVTDEANADILKLQNRLKGANELPMGTLGTPLHFRGHEEDLGRPRQFGALSACAEAEVDFDSRVRRHVAPQDTESDLWESSRGAAECACLDAEEGEHDRRFTTDTITSRVFSSWLSTLRIANRVWSTRSSHSKPSAR